MPAATAVIQAVGIILFSYQITPGRLIAVAPRIPCPSEVQSEADTAEKAMNDAGVEEHETILAFSDFRSASGWTPAKFTTLDGVKMLYVKLDGEKIRFISGSSRVNPTKRTDATARLAPTAPSTGRPGSVISELGLPHVGVPCCAHPALRPEYTPATDYRLAAAVIDFSGGSGSGCRLTSGREDTKINFDNDGTLIVEGTKGETKKTITFDGSVYLVFANVPVNATGGTSSCRAINAHYKAYGAMVQPCTEEVPCPDYKSNAATCDGPKLKPGPGSPTVISHHTPVILGARLTAECSNNQWP